MGNEQSHSTAKTNSNHSQQNIPSGIVVVAQGTAEGGLNQDENQHVERLSYCPSFLPILKSAILQEGGKIEEGDLVSGLDKEAVLKVCLILQNYLKDCAELVTKDQSRLTEKIKTLDLLAVNLMQAYTERQKKFAKHAEYTKKIEETSTLLRKVRLNLDHTLSLIDELNQQLPENERLEKFQ